MALTPAQEHRLRVTAAIQAAAADEDMSGATGYELMLAKLASDKRRLKKVQSLTERARIKRELLPDYQPYIEGVLADGRGAQDDVLVTVMLWCIDAGVYGAALHLAEYAIKYKLVMPDQYQRTLATLVAEEIASAAKTARDSKAAFDVLILIGVDQLTADQDMPDQVRAKLRKEAGLLFAQSSEPDEWQRALDLLRSAVQLDNKVGVKKDIEKLERELDKNPPDGG